MEIYLAGTAVSLRVPLQDRAGNQIVADSIEFRVVNHLGAELVARQALSSFSAGAVEAVIDIAADVNAVAAIDPMALTSAQVDTQYVREGRTVELFLTVAGNISLVSVSYALEPTDALVPGLNSFQGFPQAELTALDIPGLTGWATAADGEKLAALIEARLRICRLRFALLNSNVNFGQDNLNYVPEGTFPTPYAGAFMFNGNLALLTPAQFAKLPPRFVAALRRAQVAEADAILGGNPVDVRRQEGLILESIGEVKQMFRGGKPLDMPVSKTALRYLGPFISFAKRIGRG